MRLSTGLAIGLLLIAAAAGCDQSDGVPTAGGSAKAADTADGVKFAQCMRENGVPDFADPVPNADGDFGISLPAGADPAQVDAALNKCRPLLPNGGQPREMDPAAIEQQRKLSQCMRENGVPDFPDPKAGGGIDINAGPGLDPNDPAFKEAEKKCSQYTPPGSGTTNRNG